MKTTLALPRILLVEDEPTSCAFLAAAVRALPARVDCAGSVAAARVLADAGPYELWLVDANLPDGTGTGLLARLQGLYPGIPGIAHTASSEPAVLQALALAGFQDVLVKPLSSATLQAAVRRVLGISANADTGSTTHPAGDQPLWDDDAAATVLNGNRHHIEVLRRLFRDELPLAHQRVMAAAGERRLDQLQTELHKLRASCGFVGAARLGQSVGFLQQYPEAPDVLAQFDVAAQATLTWLRQEASISG